MDMVDVAGIGVAIVDGGYDAPVQIRVTDVNGREPVCFADY